MARMLYAAASLLLLLLGGCVTAGVDPEEAPFGHHQVNPAGANSLVTFNTPRVRSAELAALVCPSSADNYAHWTAEADPLANALQCFARDASAPDQRALVLRRNTATGYLLLRSDQACGMWFTYLERAGAINRGTFDVLGILTGGAGALVEGTGARVLSGVSGIASGTGAAIDAALLHGLTEGLIMPRILAARATRREAIEHRLGDDLAAYPVSIALADAVAYHAACNLSSALQSDTPAAAVGRSLDVATEQAARLATLRATLAGARPPAAADVRKGAIFWAAGRGVLVVTAVPAAGDASRAITFDVVGGKTGNTAPTPAAFLALVKDGVVLDGS